MEELHILLTPNKEHRKVFPDVPVVGFLNGKSLKDYLVRAKLSKLEESGKREPCGKKSCLVCDSISTSTTFTTEACQETFKIQKGPLNCDSEKVLYLLKCKVCGGVFRKGNQKVPQKRFHAHYCRDGHSGINDWDFVLFEKCENT